MELEEGADSPPRGRNKTTCKTRQRTGGEALRCCWPWCCRSGTRARENSSEAERTRIQFTAQGPPAGPWGAPAVSCARTTPDRSDWSRQCNHCSKQPSSRLRSRIWMSLRTPWQRVGAGGGGRAHCKIQLTSSSSPCQRETSQFVTQTRRSVVNSGHRSGGNVCSKLHAQPWPSQQCCCSSWEPGRWSRHRQHATQRSSTPRSRIMW